MTKSEADRIEELTQVVYRALGRMDSVLETVPNLMTKEMCEERHGSGARSLGDKLKGAQSLLAIGVAIAAVLVAAFLH